MARSQRLRVLDTAPPSHLARSVEEYLTHCRAKGLAPKTVELGYGWPLRQIFLPWAAREGLHAPSDVTPRALDRLAADLLTRPGRGGTGTLSKHTVYTYLRAVNQWSRWAKQEGEAVPERAQAPLPKLPKSLPDVLSRDQIDALEAAAASERDRLIVRVLADTGLRVGELLELRTGDLLPRTRGSFLRVKGKGDRERQVPVYPKLARRLERYIAKTRPKDAHGDQIFLGLRRSAATGLYEPLTPSGVQQSVRDLGLRCGISQPVHPHLFRHSFATWALNEGVNPIHLAEVMGHTSLVMIQQVYAHISPSDAYEAFAKILSNSDGRG
ncbi:MAG: tyrosine-type recombinase/integrase [Candidatus Dormiibacterota bacterium]